MKVRELHSLIEESLQRNLTILAHDEAQETDTGRRFLLIEHVERMLSAVAANLAQGLAHRVVDEDMCSACNEPLVAELQFVLSNGKRLHPGCL